MGDLVCTKYNFKILENKISYKRQWLNDLKGLNMPPLIDTLLNKYKSNLTKEEIDKFFSGLDILKLTDYPNIDNIYKHSRILNGDIKKYGKIIRGEDGSYDFLNKLDSNYSQLSKFISYLIQRMLKDENEDIRLRGENAYNHIETDLENGLLEFRNQIFEIANIYLKEIADYREIFTDSLVHFSGVGDYSESLVLNYLANNDFKILYQGGNGDFIDKVYGIDFIVHHALYGYLTIQVKHNNFDLIKTFGKYKSKGINLGIVANKTAFEVYNLQNEYTEFNIFNTEHVIRFINFKKNYINYDGILMTINDQSKTIKPLLVKKCNSIDIDNDIYSIDFVLCENEIITKDYIGFLDEDDNVVIFNNKNVTIEKESTGKTLLKISKKYLLFEENL